MGFLFPVLFLAAASKWFTHLANVATYNVLNHHVQFFGLVIAPVMVSTRRSLLLLLLLLLLIMTRECRTNDARSRWAGGNHT